MFLHKKKKEFVSIKLILNSLQELSCLFCFCFLLDLFSKDGKMSQ